MGWTNLVGGTGFTKTYSLFTVQNHTVYCKLATPHIFNKEARTNWLELVDHQVGEQKGGVEEQEGLSTWFVH